MVSAAGGPYEDDRENLVPVLEARMQDADADALPPGFLEALADGLGISGPERESLAVAYTFDRAEEPGPESGAGSEATCA